MTRIVLLSTSDTDLLSARASGADFALGNPTRLDATGLTRLLDGADVVIVRILGSARSWQDGLDQVLAGTAPVVVLGGEQTPDAELMGHSTVPVGTAAQTHHYLAFGGPENLAQLHGFLSDTLLMTGDVFEPPAELPTWGISRADSTLPKVGILYYRAHHASGNSGFAQDLADAVDETGKAVGIPIFCSSLRGAPADLLAELSTLDALVVTVLAAGGTKPAQASAGGDDESWDVAALAELDIPILQALCLTWDRDTWAGSDEGVSPMDSASQIAVPEFDGRIITTAFSFKEFDRDGLPHYVTDPERCRRVAGIAVGHAVLRHVPPAERKVAIVLSAYPTKHSRVGNAVGLDTPVSAVRLLRAMHDAGYNLGSPDERPWLSMDPSGDDAEEGNLLIHSLIAAGGQDEEWLTAEDLAGNPVRVSPEQYREWTKHLPTELTDAMRETWGDGVGELFVDADGAIVLATLQAGNVVIMIQPPRGFGENPVAIYHSPDMPPSHHYLAAYRWVENEFGAHAVVHLGKHGSLEWLPGKNAGLSASCGTDAAIGNLPLIYPFLVNDPGEGAQAKRRAHAIIIDHLIPPMARAESYGDIARLEQLLDEHANISAMDPSKLPAIRAQIWTLMEAAKLDRDLGLENRPDEEVFDEFLLDVDGWLCEIKDAQIRDGLHILGEAPDREGRINLVVSMLRAAQIWGGKSHALPGLRTALGLAEGADSKATDAAEKTARTLVIAMEDAGWAAAEAPVVVLETLGREDAPVTEILEFAAEQIVPRLAATTNEMTAILHALDGGYIPAGPSGSPLRGLVNVLPTGRNFYTVDPKAVPSQLAYETGAAMADSLLERYKSETGEYPPSVGLSVWGTSAMRTAGDDIAEVLALIGVRPRWDAESRRITDLAVIDLKELGRPRIDVTVRISGFFRDAFPHVIGMLDDAFEMVATLDEPGEMNFIKAHAERDIAEHGDERRARTRIFGSKPGAYGAGILPLIESGNWRDDGDLAEVYTSWGGFAYGRDLHGEPAAEDMASNYKRIAVAAKNTDTREHDIADSDDYFQYHGGMIATVRALTGRAPRSYIGDSTVPDAIRTRSLAEETARVFRSRVVNPRWLEAMRRHGYKGAFEMSATVDYLFGYDATTGVVHDWMYESLAQTYALDQVNQDFLRDANPWALRGIIERLTEAADRGLWAEPDPNTLADMRQAYLDVEGDLEDRG
ncbi:cobaltochelatase subunit CobN [Tomitella biformata]|uniref:cobaltochelatase subunit CobN n=1 Tax=Tomitella biformata TaxID=630403 RepID=UPI0004639F0B|nr:cobaltochelatase subunit CobN [Tomitella biformata]